ncbi:MAG: acetyl-CoA carboxylase biotin carboxyl carrier protein subunit [Actinobacteria bacterium]|nr:acetyl-CoA carboxylase biotin carboxyl carrier protein subunit [Actinomycetota bacterium]
MADEKGFTPVVAPMVGKVAAVEVSRGDRVAVNDPVVYLEAMKMKLKVVTPVAGTVSDVKVAPGQAVETGAVLVEIGP